jgi:hypothetical protein
MTKRYNQAKQDAIVAKSAAQTARNEAASYPRTSHQAEQCLADAERLEREARVRGES